MVKLEPGAHEALLAATPQAFFSFGGWSRNGATGVQLSKVKPARLRALLEEAYRGAVAR